MKTYLKTFYSLYVEFIIVLVILVFTGCAGSKKVEKSKLDTSIASNTDVNKKTDETSSVKTEASGETATSKSTQSTENKSKESETKNTKYDTSKPIVPGTGKPPVAEETVNTTTEISNKDMKIIEDLTSKFNLQVEENKHLKQAYDSLLNTKLSQKANTESKETPVSNWWKWMLSGVVITIVLQLAWKFTPLGKLSFFFNKIFSKFAISNK